MNKEEATKLFRPYLGVACPACKVRPNMLCYSDNAWVHSSRIALVDFTKTERPSPDILAQMRNRNIDRKKKNND